MDIDLSPDQQLFRETTTRFIEARCPIEAVRALADDPRPPDAALLREAAELGWYSSFVPEDLGGGSVSASPVRDAVIVAEERGRLVQPGPFVGTNVVAAALADAGRPEQQEAWLPRLATGEVAAAWAISDRSGAPEPGALTARREGADVVLSGTAGLVVDGAAAGLLLVTALEADGGVVQCLVAAGVPGVTVRPLVSLDITRQVAEVAFDAVTVASEGILGDGDAAARLAQVARQVDLATTLGLAESIGAMQRLVEITVAYAKDRTAFGRPIGSFQALKHLLADASFAVEVSTAGATAAAHAVGDRSSKGSEIVSLAKAYAGDAGVEVAQICQQVHGGIGFTWEHDLHLYLRRLAVDRVLHGDPTWHRERVCRLHGL